MYHAYRNGRTIDIPSPDAPRSERARACEACAADDCTGHGMDCRACRLYIVDRIREARRMLAGGCNGPARTFAWGAYCAADGYSDGDRMIRLIARTIIRASRAASAHACLDTGPDGPGLLGAWRPWASAISA